MEMQEFFDKIDKIRELLDYPSVAENNHKRLNAITLLDQLKDDANIILNETWEEGAESARGGTVWF
jgi:hypothetical protein